MNRKIIILCVFLSIILSGCKTTGTLISPIVLETFVKESDLPKSYYTKERIGHVTKGLETDYTIIERWIKKTENGYEYKHSIKYNEKEGFISIYSDGIEKTKSTNSLGEEKYSSTPISPNYVELVLTSIKDIFINEVSNLAETHDMKIIGNEKIAGRDTLHIEYTLKDNKNENTEIRMNGTGYTLTNSQYEKVELWVDKDSYRILKAERVMPDEKDTLFVRETLEYDDKTVIPDSVFEMDIPEDIKIENSVLSRNITKDELISKIGDKLLTLNSDIPWEVSYNYSEFYLGSGDPYIEIESIHKLDDKIRFKIVITKPPIFEYKADLKGKDSSTIIKNIPVSYIYDRNLVSFNYKDYDYKIFSYNHNINREELYIIADDLLEDSK